MTPAAKQLYDFLVADLEATDNTEFATELLDDAKAKIRAGKGSALQINSGSQNGKSFQGQIVCTSIDVGNAARAALDSYADGNEPTGFTVVDFSRM